MNPLKEEQGVRISPSFSPSIEQKLTQTKHRISAELLNPQQKVTAKKVAIIALGILLSPLIATGLILAVVAKAVYTPGKMIHDKIIKSLNDKSLIGANEKMKQGEEIAKLNGLQAIVNDAKVNVSEITKITEEKFKNTGQIAEAKIVRYLQREVARGNLKLTSDEMATFAHDIATEIAVGHLTPQQVVASYFKIFGAEYTKNNPFFNQLNNELNALNRSQAFPKFKKELDQLITHLMSGEPAKAAKVNTQFVQDLRAILSTDIYQTLKEDPTDPSIRLIHQLCSGIWNHVKVMNSYKEFGERMLDGIDSTKPMADVLKETWQKGSQELHTKTGLDQLTYTLNNTESAWGSLTSQNLVGTYDPHAFANNPSLQGITQTGLGDTEVNIHNCYGGSPTIANELSPEFLAVLQAAENNQIADDADRIPSVPDMISYTNFQQLSEKGGEGPRSRAIMMANETYPLSFLGVTLTKDTSFYKMSKHVEPWRKAEDFGKEVKNQIINNESFQLLSHYTKEQGFHFGGDQKRWELIIDSAIQMANQHFQVYDSQLPLPSQKTFEHKAAYLEFVYSLLQAAQEMEAAQKAKLANPHRKEVLVMAIRACKENIDRGGAANAQYIYNRLPDDHPDRQSLITGAFHSRALAVRNRMILEHRAQHLFAFMDHIQPATYRQYQQQMFDALYDQPQKQVYQVV